MGMLIVRIQTLISVDMNVFPEPHMYLYVAPPLIPEPPGALQNSETKGHLAPWASHHSMPLVP